MRLDDELQVIWPKKFKPLPKGYAVYQLDSGHYIWTNSDEVEGLIHWDPYWVRRSAFAHAAKEEQACYPECRENMEACNGCPAYE